MLGQTATRYEVRLRTSVTNQYGVPSLSTPDGSLTTSLTHVVYTRDGLGVTRFYLDGVLAASGSVGGSFSNWGDYVLALANEPTGNRGWLGELYIVAIFDRVLSQVPIVNGYKILGGCALFAKLGEGGMGAGQLADLT